MAQTFIRRRLTQTEAAFLYSEKPDAAMHIGGCSLYEGHLSRDTLLRLIESRLHRLPQYRQKVVFSPLGIAHPTWEDDPAFDLAHHIEEVSLPDPADDNVLSQVCGQLFASPLDRRRPLWKLILMHGRPDGNTMVMALVHQAMLEGVSGIDLMLVLHDIKPDGEPAQQPTGTWQAEPLPDALSLLQEAFRDRITEVAQRWADMSFRLLRPAAQGIYSRRMANAVINVIPTLLRQVPSTPFNKPLSGQRQLVWLELSYAEVRFIRSVLRGTVNNVVLAIIAGGLGRYLQAKGQKIDGVDLRTACPINLKRHEPRNHRNAQPADRTSTILIPLYIGITDPILRLAAQKAASEELQEQDQAGTFHAIKSVCHWVPPAWQALVGHMPSRMTLANTVVMNIPGPQIPLYLAGHKRHAFFPMGPLVPNIGLFHAIASYNQKLTIGVTVDPQLMPDVWAYTECLRASFSELRQAAEQFSQRSASPTSHHNAASSGSSQHSV